MKIKTEPWLDSTGGIGPQIGHESFNNIVFSTEYLIGRLVDKSLTHDEMMMYKQHVQANKDEFGGYKPKNSHDNITALLVGLLALESGQINDIDLGHVRSGKHPRDWLFYSMLLSRNPLYWLGLPFILFEIYRAAVSRGKIRPVFWQDKSTFWWRTKAYFGLISIEREEEIFAGTKITYSDGNELFIIQNDGKLLNFLRLYILKRYAILRPFVRFIKKKYVELYGDKFQSKLFANYFRESDHPVRVIYGKLDNDGVTIIDI